MKHITLCVAAFAATLSPALASQNFSRSRCESPQIQQYILNHMAMMKAPDGTLFMQRMDAKSISDAQTLGADANRLVCRITMDVGYGANRRDLRGKFTFMNSAQGGLMYQWTPLY
jgi:hypothetical protein